MIRRGPKAILVLEWPELDREAWEAARRPVDVLEENAAGARWSAATWLLTERGYGIWLGWLAARGDLDRSAPAQARVNADRLRQYFNDLQAAGLADHTRACHVQALGDALRVLAPTYDGRAISAAAGRMHAHAEPVRDPLARTRPAAELLKLGLELMHAADSGGVARHKRAIMYRDGLLIAFLILCPLRIRSLAALRLGKNLKRSDALWRVELQAEDMKGRRPFECGWPEFLCPHLDRYLDSHRPALLAGRRGHEADPSGLWLSTYGTVMKEASLAQAIEIATRKAFGKHIGPHQFRHIVATEVATNSPDDASDIAAVLAHSSIEVSEKYYNHARGIEAVRAYHAAIIARVGSQPRPKLPSTARQTV